MRITTLSENTAGKRPKGLLAEYGLSILVEADERKILFDTGQKKSAVNNAAILGIDLSDIEKIVLSHGHFDHTGGLKSVLEKTGEIEIIAHPDIFQKKYAKFGKKKTYIGIPDSREELEESGANFKLTKEPTKIGDITATGEVDQKNDFEKIDKNLYVQEGDDLRSDELLDDQALAIKTDKGLFIVLGCAHRGMINNIEQAKNITGEDRVYGVIGGTHLIAADKVQMDETVKALKKYDIQKIGVSHCTGPKASSRLADEFGEKFFYNNAGSVIEI
ncbi:MAG: MBL fold metallo-hydrolase [Halobacteriota archaeon]|nr:MBL fold metallo-hydrolase [Halobacteriota archaeon]